MPWARSGAGASTEGGHNETYRGVAINVDSDCFDAPIATSRPSIPVHQRQCTQTPGSTVGTTSVCDKLVDSRWVSDYYVATPNKTTYSRPAVRC